MGTTIDQNVVQMRFDNAEFERNIQTSMGSLNNLKNTISNGIITSGLTSSIKTISGRFSTMGLVGVTALQNITNSAINAGKQILNSLTIEPIKTGLNEYELKMNSIQTILAGGRKKNGARVSLDEVKEGLEELNKYADQTIYSFKDMVDNIGKFSNAGVDWETSVSAIQGVANAAALAGSNSNQASHAMYNFSQALAAGYVKMVDWRSIEYAGMATRDFKDELLKTAIACGTVEKTSSGLYKALSDNNAGKTMKDATKATGMFTEGLQYQWLTSEVLTKTLSRYSDETTEIGKRATDAATVVKTFSQLLGVLREEAQSGWAMTWEYIIGDFEEAKNLWTGVKNEIVAILDSQAESRNALIKGWVKEGGRKALIGAVKNSWLAFLDVAKNIKSAFRDVFPAMTSKRLADITKNIEAATAKFRLNSTAANQLKSIYRGLFASFDLSLKGLKAVLNFISPLTDMIASLAFKFVEITANIGDFIYQIDQSNDKFKVFQDRLGKITGLFSSGSGDGFGDKLKKMFSGGGEEAKKSLSWIEAIKKSISDLFSFGKKGGATGEGGGNAFVDILLKPIKAFFSLFKTTIKSKGGGSGEVIKDVFSKIVNTLLKVIKDVGKRLYDSILNNLDIFKMIKFRWSIKNAGGLFALFKVIEKFFNNLNKGITNSNGDAITGSIIATLYQLQQVLIAYQKNIKAGTLVKIATSVGILALALIAISGLSPDELGNGIIGIGALLTELVVAMKVLNDLPSNGGNSLGAVAKTMRKMASSVFIIAIALETLAKLPIDNMFAATEAISVLMVGLTAMSLALNKYGQDKKGPKGLLTMAASLLVISQAVKSLASLNPDELANGLFGIFGVVSALGLFLSLTNFDKMGIGKGLGILLIAEAIKVLSASVAALAAIDTSKIGQGLFAIGALLVELGLFKELTKDAKSMILFSTSLIVIAFAIDTLAKTVGTLGALNPDQLGQGLFGIGALFIELIALSHLLGDAKSLIQMGIAMNSIGKAITQLSASVVVLSGIDPSALGQGLFAIGALLTEIGLFQTFAGGAEKMITTALALVIMAAGIKTLVTALNAFAVTDPNQMSAGLIMLAGALLMIVIALNAVNGSIIGALALLVVAAAIRVLVPALEALGGMSVGAIVKSLVALAAGLAIIGAAAALMTPLIIPLIGLSIALALFGAALVVVSIGLTAFGAVIVAVFNTLAHVFTYIVEKLTEFINAFSNANSIVTGVAGSIAKTLGSYILHGLADALSLLPGIGDAMGKKLHAAADKMTNSIDTEKPKQKTKEMKDKAVTELDDMPDKYGEASKKASDSAASNLDSSKVKKASADMKKASVSEFKGIDKDISGEYQKASKAAQKNSESVSKNTNIKTNTAASSNEGAKLGESYAKGIKKSESKVKSASKKVGESGASAVEKTKSKFVTSGEHTGEGIAKGIKSKRSSVESAAKSLANSANSAYNSTLNIKSPSKVMMWSGRMTVMGVVKGITDNIKHAASSAGRVASAVHDAITDRINTISDDIDTSFDYSPVITPVLDLNSVNNGVTSIDRSLGGLSKTISLSPELSNRTASMAGAMNKIQNANSNADVVSAIGKLRRDIGNIQPIVNNVNGVTYDDGSNIHEAVGTLIRATVVKGRA